VIAGAWILYVNRCEQGARKPKTALSDRIVKKRDLTPPLIDKFLIVAADLFRANVDARAIMILGQGDHKGAL